MSPKGDLRSPRLSPKRNLRVEKKKLIGSGGSGCKVYSAKIEGFVCCVKELPIDLAEEDTKAFEQEITILKNLPKSSHLIRYLGFQNDGTMLQLYMTLCGENVISSILLLTNVSRYDGTLHDLIQNQFEQGPFTEQEVIRMACHVLKALVALHTDRLMHRDVKSSNIYFEEYDSKRTHLVLGDFGESKIIPKHTRTSTITGTDRWIAPEVLMSNDSSGYSLKADIWSFGMVLWVKVFFFHDFIH